MSLIVTDCESDDVISIILIINKLSKIRENHKIYILTTDYNTHIKKQQIDKILEIFSYENIKTNCLTPGLIGKYKTEGDGIIELTNYKFTDDHNIYVRYDIEKYFENVDDVDLILLANVQGLPDVIASIFGPKIKTIVSYGGYALNRLSYNWRRSIEDMRILFDMIKKHNKHLYVMTPNVIYGKHQPGRLTVYNNDKNVADIYKNLVATLKQYPIVWKIIHNWCMYMNGGKLTEQAFSYVDNVQWEEFKDEVENNSMIMTPADISTSIMYLDILEDRLDRYEFDNYSDVILKSKKKIGYVESNDDNLFHMCSDSSNENFINYIQELIEDLNA